MAWKRVSSDAGWIGVKTFLTTIAVDDDDWKWKSSNSPVEVSTFIGVTGRKVSFAILLNRVRLATTGSYCNDKRDTAGLVLDHPTLKWIFDHLGSRETKANWIFPKAATWRLEPRQYLTQLERIQSTAMSGIMRNNGNDFISMPFLRLYSLVFLRKPKGVVKRATLLLSISAVVSSPAWFLAILKVIVFDMIPMELKLRRNGNRGNEERKKFRRFRVTWGMERSFSSSFSHREAINWVANIFRIRECPRMMEHMARGARAKNGCALDEWMAGGGHMR